MDGGGIRGKAWRVGKRSRPGLGRLQSEVPANQDLRCVDHRPAQATDTLGLLPDRLIGITGAELRSSSHWSGDQHSSWELGAGWS
ncbi:hypothetical protein RRG08_047108 [Elysia crispata]|uniref:Uncharacterized protein n=1 Tax=Elysia crispata TaxID=231223 RepID=A0AAE1AP65_9GAST|nr:hypothetical protein RRG08_047108 [Elysia crispata]